MRRHLLRSLKRNSGWAETLSSRTWPDVSVPSGPKVSGKFTGMLLAGLAPQPPGNSRKFQGWKDLEVRRYDHKLKLAEDTPQKTLLMKIIPRNLAKCMREIFDKYDT